MSDTVLPSPSQVIRTPDQRLRVFLSGDATELAAERDAVRRAITSLHLTPVAFETGARPHPPRSLYRAYLDQSHVFIGVYGERYGWVAPDLDISGVEDEYLLSGDRPRLIYVREPAPDRDVELTRLLATIEADDRASYKVFGSPEELEALVARDLALLLTERFEVAAAPLDRTGRAPSHVPTPPAAIIGRESEIAATCALLERPDVRLLTLTGPGGIGKTRLSLEIAGRLLSRYPDGVYVVSLGAITDHRLVLPTVAGALGVHAEGSRPLVELLASELAGQQLLLVLDNFEQVLDAAPDVAALLAACPGLTALVTSRAPLRLRGEHEYPVPPLDVPSTGRRATPEELLTASGVQLFIERATQAHIGFRLDASNAEAVAELVRRLDGVPLAIELAAARVRLLTPQALLDRLGDRIDLLSTDLADLPPRQRTLRATIDWSYDLLDGAERRLFGSLGVFRSSFPLSAVETVCDDQDGVLDVLASLVEKSLVVPEHADTEPRFRLLRTVREYALDRLAEAGERERLEERHARYVFGLADEAAKALRTEDQEAWLDRLDRALDDIRAAMRWGLDHDASGAVRLGYALRIFWWMRDHMAEARQYEEELLPHLDELGTDDRSRLLFMTGASAWLAGDYDVARPRLEEALACGRELDDVYLRNGPLILLAPLVHEDGDTETAEAYLSRSLTEARTIPDDSWGVAYNLLQYSQFAARTGDVPRAKAMTEEMLAISRQIQNRPFTAQALVFLGYLELLGGNVDASREHLAEAAGIFRGLRYREGLSYVLTGFAAIAVAEQDAERAATLLGAAAGLREQIGSQPWQFLRPIIEGLEAAASSTAGEQSYQQARDAGRSMTPDAMASYALMGAPA